MKVLYDHQAFTFQKFGGISRYFYEMIRFYKQKSDAQILTPKFLSNNYYISDKCIIDHVSSVPKKEFRGKQRILFFINEIISSKALKKQNFDLFHPTYYDTYFLKYIKNKPFVVTVYDMVHEKFSDLLPPDKVSQNKRMLCEKATKIIAISENTKKDLIDLFDINENKIDVIYLGNSMVHDKNIKMKTSVPEKYILFVGSRVGYKNFERFIEAVSLLIAENPDLFIVCIGGGSFSKMELSTFSHLDIENNIVQLDIDDQSLASFYFHAMMFVFPSLYEGFGIPVLESFACSCPLVCSNTSSLPEIADNAAMYFDPYDKTSIYAAIKKIFYSNDERKQLIANGRKRLKCFSWEKTSKQTLEVYSDILND